jgi:hypothetical protein
MARERESLFDTALSLAGRMTVTLFTSKILKAQLEDAIRFLGSDEHPPAQKLHEKLGRINRILATISTAAVDAHEGQRLRFSTPPGNQQPGPSSVYLNQHADGHRAPRSPESIPGHQAEPLSAVSGRRRLGRDSPPDSYGSREEQRTTARKRRRESAVARQGDAHNSARVVEEHDFFTRYVIQRIPNNKHQDWRSLSTEETRSGGATRASWPAFSH